MFHCFVAPADLVGVFFITDYQAVIDFNKKKLGKYYQLMHKKYNFTPIIKTITNE